MDLGGVTGQHLARRRDVEELPAPAAHAFLRPQRVIIRHHKVDGQNALEPDLGFLDDAAGLLHLFQGRHQRRAVFQCPAVILHIGDLEPVGVEIDRHLDDVGQLMQVLPVHHRIDRQRQVQFAGPFCDLQLLLMRLLQPGDAVGDSGLVALKADLDVAEPGIGQCGKLFAGQQHGRSDEI